MQKTAPKNTYHSTNEGIFKIAKNGHQAGAIDFANRHFGSKIKNALKHAKNVSTTHCSCSMQKTAPKNS